MPHFVFSSRHADVFKVFKDIVHAKRLHNYPGVKAIMAIGQMLADAACDEKLDGMFTFFLHQTSEDNFVHGN